MEEMPIDLNPKASLKLPILTEALAFALIRICFMDKEVLSKHRF
jgi:hypothetical protein